MVCNHRTKKENNSCVCCVRQDLLQEIRVCNTIFEPATNGREAQQGMQNSKERIWKYVSSIEVHLFTFVNSSSPSVNTLHQEPHNNWQTLKSGYPNPESFRSCYFPTI